MHSTKDEAFEFLSSLQNALASSTIAKRHRDEKGNA
jgi:hypothetical protein